MTSRRLLISIGITIVVTAASSGMTFAGSFGGDFEFRWLNEPANKHRIMQTLGEVTFKDGAGKIWRVPKGTKIDGASIPPALWSFAGSPFTGNYRRASVIHDYFCDTKTEFRSAIHRMFMEAMATDGISGIELSTKYGAVKAFGNGCGKPDEVAGGFFGNWKIEGFEPTTELQANLENFSQRKDLGSVAERVETVTAIADVEYPRTFSALSEFRRVPSTRNYESLEAAISAEQPGDVAIDALVQLAIATVPEGSATLPDQ